MKQQWLLLLALVGMSIGVMADVSDCETDFCGNCYGYTSSDGDTLSALPLSESCDDDEILTACDESSKVPFPCGSSWVQVNQCSTDNDSKTDYEQCTNGYYCYNCSVNIANEIYDSQH